MKLKPTRAELRGTLLMLTGVAITILFISGGASLWRAEYGRGALLMTIGAGLAFAFFRKWKIDLVIIGLIWVMVNAGTNTIVHPTVPGFLVTAGSGVGIVLLARYLLEKRRTGRG